MVKHIVRSLIATLIIFVGLASANAQGRLSDSFGDEQQQTANKPELRPQDASAWGNYGQMPVVTLDAGINANLPVFNGLQVEQDDFTGESLSPTSLYPLGTFQLSLAQAYNPGLGGARWVSVRIFDHNKNILIKPGSSWNDVRAFVQNLRARIGPYVIMIPRVDSATFQCSTLDLVSLVPSDCIAIVSAGNGGEDISSQWPYTGFANDTNKLVITGSEENGWTINDTSDPNRIIRCNWGSNAISAIGRRHDYLPDGQLGWGAGADIATPEAAELCAILLKNGLSTSDITSCIKTHLWANVDTSRPTLGRLNTLDSLRCTATPVSQLQAIIQTNTPGYPVGTTAYPVGTTVHLESQSIGLITKYQWVVNGQTQSATTSWLDFTFNQAGTATAMLTVSDNNGHQNSTSLALTITSTGGGGTNHPPTLDFPDIDAEEGDITIKIFASDPDDDPISCSIIYGNAGSSNSPLSTLIFTHPYFAGIYYPTVTCTDSRGASTTKSATFTIRDIITNNPASFNGTEIVVKEHSSRENADPNLAMEAIVNDVHYRMFRIRKKVGDGVIYRVRIPWSGTLPDSILVRSITYLGERVIAGH